MNTLASTILGDVFGREHVYQLPRSVHQESSSRSSEIPHLGGRTLFGADYLYERLDEALNRGAAIKVTPLTAEFKFTAFVDHYGSRAWPLFVIDHGKLVVVTIDAPCQAIEGQSVVSLVLPA